MDVREKLSLNKRRGMRGSLETLHSTNKKIKKKTPPMTIMEIVNALVQGKEEPPPLIGISKKIIATELVKKPR